MRLTHWTALRMVYMLARIQLVVKRRMKPSNLEDVGQIRRRKGTSTKRMTNADALWKGQNGVVSEGIGLVLHAQDGEDDVHNLEGEDVGDTEGKAEDNTKHTGPVVLRQ